MGKTCELCGITATLRCSADDAELCWMCDAEVHSANYLVARHLRLVLCSCCSAETECQTSGTSPCPLSRRCASCDPAHVNVDERVHLVGSVLHECNDDSEELGSSAAVPELTMGAAVGLSRCCQEGLSDALSSVEDEKNLRRPVLESSRGRVKRLRGGGSAAVAGLRKRSLTPGHSRKQGSVRKSRKKRSRSPVSVILMDHFVSNESNES